VKLFNLPDLGEGLPEAIIREWYVKEGDAIELDQPMVAMETAKALVDVPAPFSGTVEKCFGNVGDTIQTGQPLIGFEGDTQTREDSGTVVGEIQTSEVRIEDHVIAAQTTHHITPAVAALAKRLNVDVNQIKKQGRITAQDVRAHAGPTPTTPTTTALPQQAVKLSPIQQAMLLSMTKSHHETVPVSLADVADISHWKNKKEVTIRTIRAMQHAIEKVPILNSTLYADHMAYVAHSAFHLGLAIDTPHGLTVPVIRDVATLTDEQLREQILAYKQQAHDKTIKQDDLRGATMVLSNYGAIAGRFANPILLPPAVAIIGVGRHYQQCQQTENQITAHTLLPISATGDHRLITGGDLARFLQAMIHSFQHQ